jgi:hypothetical protein
LKPKGIKSKLVATQTGGMVKSLNKQSYDMDEEEEEENDSDTEETDTEDGDSEESEKEESEEEESDDDSDEDDKSNPSKPPWKGMLRKVYKTFSDATNELKQHYLQKGYKDEVAGALAHNDLVKNYRKDLRDMYTEQLLLFQQIKRDPIYKKVIETKQQLVEEGYDKEEALQYAVKKRKFLFNSIIQEMIVDSDDSDIDID